jgi:phosphoglycolate phosphatase-like HAD superfamily hydrolase
MDDVLVLWDIDGTLLNADGVGRDLYDAVFLQLFGRSLSAYAPMAGRTDRAIILETLSLAGVDEPRRHVDPFIAGLGAQASSVHSAVAARGHALPGAAAVLATLAAARNLGSLTAAAEAGAIGPGLGGGAGLGGGLGGGGLGGGNAGEGRLAGSFAGADGPFLAAAPKPAPAMAAPPLTAPPLTAPPLTAPPLTAPPLTGPAMTAATVTAPPVTASPLGAPPITAQVMTAPVLTGQIMTGQAQAMAPQLMTEPPLTAPPVSADVTDGGRIHQSVLTGNIRSVAEVKLAALGLREWLDLCIGAYGDDHEDRTELVHVARRRAAAVHGRSAAEFDGAATVVIGDTPLDIAAALGAGARAVGVATGSYSADDLAMAGADTVLPDLTDTAAVLRALLP